MTDTTTPLLQLLLMGTGGDNNSWGTNLNNSVITPVENAIAGVNTISGLTGGAYPLTAANSAYATIILTGTLTSDLTITVPSTAKKWTFINNLTDGGFYTLVKTSGGTAVNVPTGVVLDITCDGTNMYRADRAKVGEMFHFGGTTAPAGSKECNGATPLRASAVDLFGAINTTWGAGNGTTTFTIPNSYSQSSGLGSFLRSRTAGVAVGTYQANQNKSHTHTGSGTTGTDSVDHTHTGSGATGGMTGGDPHSHGYNQPASFGFSGGGAGILGTQTGGTTGSTSVNHAHTYSFTTSGISVSHTHTYSFTTSTGSADGAEARPEALTTMICIRY